MVSASDFLDWAKDVGVHDLGPGPAGELVLLARHAGLLDHPVIGVIQGMQFDAQFSAGIHIFAPDKFPFVGYSLPAWVDTGQESWVAAAITKGGVPLPAFRLEPGDEDDVLSLIHI